MAKYRAFTLVELLVVIGIIAVLIGVLLPTLGRARESANRLACMSNLSQIAMGLRAYSEANKGGFPSPSIDFHNPDDWVFWHAGYVLNDSVIRPYLTGKSVLAPKHLTCPSDDPNSHPYGYKFSYTVNWMICEPRGYGWPDGGVYPPFKKMYAAPGDTRWRPNLKSTGIHAPSTCIMVIDESSATADDGCFAYYNHDGLQTADTWNNILSNRHDKRGEKKQLLKEGRGNVAFCDGHAEFISRLEAVNQKFWDPRKKGMPATPFGQGPGPGGSYP